MTLGPTIADLPAAALGVLEQLPCEPGVVSIFELACGQFDTDEPSTAQEARVRRALDNIARVLGGLYARPAVGGGRDGKRCMGFGVIAVSMEQVRFYFQSSKMVTDRGTDLKQDAAKAETIADRTSKGCMAPSSRPRQ